MSVKSIQSNTAMRTIYPDGDRNSLKLSDSGMNFAQAA